MKKLVVFDFDGTLINSVADLAVAVNYAMEQQGFATHPEDRIKGFIGSGVINLMQRALPAKLKNNAEAIGRSRELFINYYDAHNKVLTAPYPGIVELLDKLAELDVKVAIASNKYHDAIVNLAAYYFPDYTFSAVLGHRDGQPVKPAADIVFEVMELSGVSDKAEVLYVGDSGVDMQTAINAEVDACGVTWGFRPKAELEEFSPKDIVDSALDILKIVERA